MSGYGKLHSSIATSSLMAMPVAARWLWAYLISQQDAHGIVEGSIAGLAVAANITLEDCEAAINAFLAPDKYSRTPDEEGRRLRVVDGGWQLVTAEKYRRLRSAEERAEYQAKWLRDRRDKSRKENTKSTADVVRKVKKCAE